MMNRKMVFDDDPCLITRVGASFKKRKLYSLTVEFSMIDFLILTIPPCMGLLNKKTELSIVMQLEPFQCEEKYSFPL